MTGDAAAGPDPDNEIRAAMEAANTDHEVDLAIDAYAWANPLDVVDVDEPVEWEVPYGDNWWTRTIYVEGGNGAEYALVYSSVATPPRAECYRVDDDDRGEKRGDVDHLVLVEDLDDGYVLVSTSANRSGVFHRPDSDDPNQPICSYASKNDTWYKKQPEVLGDGWSLCQRCDEGGEQSDSEYAIGDELPADADDDTADESDEAKQASAEAVLPEGIDESDVEAAVGDHTHLNDAAEELGIKPGGARTIFVHLGLYSEVREGSRGGRDE